MADYEHCFGCLHSVYVDNNNPRHIDNGDRICLYCAVHHKYLKKNALSNFACFQKEDRTHPTIHIASRLTQR